MDTGKTNTHAETNVMDSHGLKHDFFFLFFLIQILYYVLEQLQQSQIKLHYITKKKKRKGNKRKNKTVYGVRINALQSTPYIKQTYSMLLKG